VRSDPKHRHRPPLPSPPSSSSCNHHNPSRPPIFSSPRCHHFPAWIYVALVQVSNWIFGARKKDGGKGENSRWFCDYLMFICAAIQLIICLPMRIGRGAVQKFCGWANSSSIIRSWGFFVGKFVIPFPRVLICSIRSYILGDIAVWTPD
jgi:hypothetical protein